jgi:hypothetical protein
MHGNKRSYSVKQYSLIVLLGIVGIYWVAAVVTPPWFVLFYWEYLLGGCITGVYFPLSYAWLKQRIFNTTQFFAKKFVQTIYVEFAIQIGILVFFGFLVILLQMRIIHYIVFYLVCYALGFSTRIAFFMKLTKEQETSKVNEMD